MTCASIIIYTLVLTLSGIPEEPASDVLVPSDVYRRIETCLLNSDYAAAEYEADLFISEHPDEPSGYLFKASILQFRFFDFEDETRGEEYNNLLDTTLALSRKRSAEEPGSLWAQYYACAAQSLIGARTAATGKLLQGVYRGRAGAMGMMRILEKDPGLCDASLMTGSYRFWKSVALGKLRLLPFIDDERERGLAEVEHAISCGKLNGPLSQTVLIEMLLDYDPVLAAERAEELTAAYPDCRLFLWQLGEAYKKLSRFEDAVRVFTGIAESVRADESDDGTGELRCWWKLAELAKSVGKTGEYIYYCSRVVSFREQTSLSERNRERVKKAQDMLEDMAHDGR